MNDETRESAIGHYRWVICTLLFFATTVNYIDRQILSLLKETLDRELHWTNEQFGQVNAVFQALVRDRPPAVRAVHRPLRHQDRLRHVDRRLEPGRRRSCAGRQHRRVLHGARRAGPGRRRQLPVGDQGGRALVPEAGARLRDRDLQLGHQRGRHHRAGDRALAGLHLGLALGLRRRRHRRHDLAGASGSRFTTCRRRSTA